MSLRTLAPIQYQEIGLKLRVRIPAGTPVVRAGNMGRREAYWVQAWPKIKRREMEYLMAVGFLLGVNEVGSDLFSLSGA